MFFFFMGVPSIASIGIEVASWAGHGGEKLSDD
jgi:hypothetical protein